MIAHNRGFSTERGDHVPEIEMISMGDETYRLDENGALIDPPKEPCCGTANCVLCAFGCATCCCLRDIICKRMVFAPPSPAFYSFKNNSMYRIPLDVYNNDDEFSSDQFEKLENKNLSISVHMVQTSRKGQIASVFMQHPKATKTILFSHGNAADIGIMSWHFELMAETLKVNIYGYDYTGYGESSNPGNPSPANVYADAEAAYSHLVDELKIDPFTIVFYGQSLGSGPSTYLGKKYSVSGVIIHSGLMSAVRVLNPYLTRTPWYDVFPNIDNIKSCRSPVWVIHGYMDQIINIYHGIRLYKSAPKSISPWFVKDGDHNEIEMRFETEYFLRLKMALGKFERLSKDNKSPLMEIKGGRGAGRKANEGESSALVDVIKKSKGRGPQGVITTQPRNLDNPSSSSQPGPPASSTKFAPAGLRLVTTEDKNQQNSSEMYSVASPQCDSGVVSQMEPRSSNRSTAEREGLVDRIDDSHDMEMKEGQSYHGRPCEDDAEKSTLV
mmetsp:Transcript_31217/g.50302  ORF Transcript_31217/g.50302 Transcript_31217/m.50302 type:complete len:498 (-) Transcript_31217:196-1689(-)